MSMLERKKLFEIFFGRIEYGTYIKNLHDRARWKFK